MELRIKNIDESGEADMYSVTFHQIIIPKLQAQYLFGASKIEVQVTQ